MKKYKKPKLMNDNMISKTKALVPGLAAVVSAVSGLSVGGAALIGAAAGVGLASVSGKDFRLKKIQISLKPVIID